MQKFGISERRACRIFTQSRSTKRYQKREKPDYKTIKERIISLASQYGRYGYRRISALLTAEGYNVNHKRVEKIWREEGLKVPKRMPKKKRLHVTDASCGRFKASYPNQIICYDFVFDRLSSGKQIKFLTVIDEYTRECLALICGYRLNHWDVIDALSDLFIMRGIPAFIRSDNGLEFIDKELSKWLLDLNVEQLLITPGSPWENGYNERFNGTFRDELLNLEYFGTLTEAKVLSEKWRHEYNSIRPHSALNYRSPEDFARNFYDTDRLTYPCHRNKKTSIIPEFKTGT